MNDDDSEEAAKEQKKIEKMSQGYEKMLIQLEKDVRQHIRTE